MVHLEVSLMRSPGWERTRAFDEMVIFACVVVKVFGPEYFSEPNAKEKLLTMGGSRGFLGMLGSANCMHWQWKNCSTGLCRQYQGRTKDATIILEAMTPYDL